MADFWEVPPERDERFEIDALRARLSALERLASTFDHKLQEAQKENRRLSQSLWQTRQRSAYAIALVAASSAFAITFVYGGGWIPYIAAISASLYLASVAGRIEKD